METEYRINVVEEVIYAHPYEHVGGGDMHCVHECKTKKSAMNKAIKASFMKTYGILKVYEIWMEKIVDGDLAEHWSIKDGIISGHSILN